MRAISFGFAMLVLSAGLVLADTPFATGPIPRYTSNVVANEGQGAHSSATRTKDAVNVVETWMKAHLPKGTTETTTADGAHIFYLPGGAGTVDVEKDIASGTGTSIGMTWR